MNDLNVQLRGLRTFPTKQILEGFYVLLDRSRENGWLTQADESNIQAQLDEIGQYWGFTVRRGIDPMLESTRILGTVAPGTVLYRSNPSETGNVESVTVTTQMQTQALAETIKIDAQLEQKTQQETQQTQQTQPSDLMRYVPYAVLGLALIYVLRN